MRTFNPEKELRKMQQGNRNKIIFSIMALLLIIAIGSSYALYQIRYSKQIIYTTVAPFYSKDMQISLYVDGEKDTTSETFPDKESGKIFSHITCENGSSGVFDNTKWELELKITKQDKCNVYFITGNLPNPPELYQGMIPVVYDKEGNVYVADIDSDWYNYQDHRWGNAVLVDNTKEGVTAKYFDSNNKLRDDIAGEQIPMDEILQMYVWIPRYKYQLWNVNNEGVPKQLINIKFEKGIETTGDITCKYTNEGNGIITESCLNEKRKEASNGEWYTHPAFTFKGTLEDNGTELKGIWVGKFEASDPEDPTGRADTLSGITILPNKTSTVRNPIGTMFYTTRSIEQDSKYNLNSNEIDTHMMKNVEWGAVAYLTQSIYGIYKDENTCNIDNMSFNECEVWINNTVQGITMQPSTQYNYGGTHTGCVGDKVDAAVKLNNNGTQPAMCDVDKQWNIGGVKASTTGNMYGIYDMNGGAYDHIMGVLIKQTGDGPYLDRSGFDGNTISDSKYYDLYTFDTSYTTYERGHLGDATREIVQNLKDSNTGGWNGDTILFPSLGIDVWQWFSRGGWYAEAARAGLFNFIRIYYGANTGSSIRVVLTAP